MEFLVYKLSSVVVVVVVVDLLVVVVVDDDVECLLGPFLRAKWRTYLNPDGTIEKYSARLVGKEYRQKEGQDFFDTYSSIKRIQGRNTTIIDLGAENIF
ncbi:hypothetical protein OSB04_023435 [Centaurea solstitialis]|uniref:Uncharacterized protein n=1 Tax=Centaurea solstitialis TaxID=347529 RepID=A0AA38T3U1_9ASTR|nr:hypothetical protein OSB04_023435 [Centaurea solstitialis]